MTHRTGMQFQPAGDAVPGARRQTELMLIGHDLRAAMADVVAALQGMEVAGPPDTPRGQLHRARAAADTLSRLLDAALAEASDMPRPLSCPPETVALVTLLDRIEARWTAPAAERGLDLILDLSPDAPGVLLTDRITLERILSNIVGNGAIHATRGPVTLSVGTGPGGGPVFAVTDAGPGLPDRLLSRATADALPDVTATGAPGGLGLFIARELARRIGADLALSNLPDGGACVRLSLPADALPVFPVVETPPDLSGLHILVAEDSTSQRQATTALLRSLGARVTATGDAAAACAIALSGGLDAMLLDATLTAETTLAAIRGQPGATGALPVLAVTRQDDAATHARLRAAGADGVAVKPIACPVALGLAVLALPLGRSAAPDTEGPDPTECDPATLERLMLLVGPDAMADLCARLRADLTGLRGGIARSSRPPVDAASLRRHAHGLVALSGTCGATGLQQAAQHLHQMAEAHAAGPDALLRARLDAGFDALLARIDACAAGIGR